MKTQRGGANIKNMEKKIENKCKMNESAKKLLLS